MTEARLDEQADAFEPNPAATWLASVQNAILDLRRWPRRGAGADEEGIETLADLADDSIEVHVAIA
ncbi:MAG: hypothetical protein WDN30_15675 [Pararobbsia sp.]